MLANTITMPSRYRSKSRAGFLNLSTSEIWGLVMGLSCALQGLPRQLGGKESTRQFRRRGFDPWVGEIPWRRKWQPTPALLLEKFKGQRSLAGYSPWCHKESDWTEQLSMHVHWRFFVILGFYPCPLQTRYSEQYCSLPAPGFLSLNALLGLKIIPVKNHWSRAFIEEMILLSSLCTCIPTVGAEKSRNKNSGPPSQSLSSVQSLSHVQLFATPWTAAHQASLSINSWSLLKLMSFESVKPSRHLICWPLLLPSIFPSISTFSSESVLPIRWPEFENYDNLGESALSWF